MGLWQRVQPDGFVGVGRFAFQEMRCWENWWIVLGLRVGDATVGGITGGFDGCSVAGPRRHM